MVLSKHLGSLSGLTCLDVGCSMGFISQYLGKFFKNVYGVDVDNYAIKKAKELNTLRNVKFLKSEENKLPFPNKSFDVAVFNQIYEHAEEPQKIVEEIDRVLKKGGVCFMGARNKYGIFDGHYNLPFIAWLPRKIADFYVKKFKNKDYYDIKLFSLSDLKKMVSKFIVKDYTLSVIKNPEHFKSTDSIPTFLDTNKIIYLISKILYGFIPNYIWVLEKKE
ncbi:MAG: class I SAM-dependent methyltransferase [bacterium]